SSQLVVTQPLSVAEPPGTTVKLSCALSSGYSIGSDRVRWLQQKPGSVPRFVYHYYTSSDQGRGTGIPVRFTISPNTSNNLWNLVISGVQAEDEAGYYCYTWDGFSFQQLQSLKASELVSPGGTVTLSCSLSSGALADNNYPRWVQQRLGNVPRLIMHSTSTRPSGIPERFTGSRSSNTMSLTITGALAEDDADYYCSVWTGSADHSDTVRWGSDTKTSLP
uniref:Ig-like domain-containing protein n=1 Tax=Gopherus evgoodei TaxID=1825980 RepID=A0A8C4WQA5_9SAUR